MLYSPSTGGFYHPAINGDNIPQDAVEITAAQHAALLEGQSSGLVIVADEGGYPVLADAPAPGNDRVAELARVERNSLLASCDWTQLADAPLSESEKSAWVVYRQELRNIPQQQGFPLDIDWPTRPE